MAILLFIATILSSKWLNMTIVATENCIFIISIVKIHKLRDAFLA